MQVKQNVNLREYSTFSIGGIAKNFYVPENIDDLIHVIEIDPQVKIIGNGSNILINDRKVFENVCYIKEVNNIIEHLGKGRFRVGASLTLQKLITTINQMGYGGIESLITVPGLVGGSIAMNAGSGQGSGIHMNHFIGDYVEKVIAISNNIIVTYNHNECNFSFRNSIFKNSNLVIIEVIFCFEKVTKTQISESIKWKVDIVKNFQDQKMPSLGSFFSEYNYRLMKFLRFFFNLIYRNGVNFSINNPGWLCNRGKGKFNQAMVIIFVSRLSHRILLRKFKVEIVIWK